MCARRRRRGRGGFDAVRQRVAACFAVVVKGSGRRESPPATTFILPTP